MWDDDDDESEIDDDLTIHCPHCLGLVYEDAEQCPHCGNYLSKEDMPWSRPIWLVVGVVICLGIVFYWFFR